MRGTHARIIAGMFLWITGATAQVPPGQSVTGHGSIHFVVHDASGQAAAGVEIEIRRSPDGEVIRSATDSAGAVDFAGRPAGSYAVTVEWKGARIALPSPLALQEGERLDGRLDLDAGGNQLTFRRTAQEAQAGATGGKQLSSKEVSSLPLNKRDFSQLLLLASGTTTDTNGAANFTQQFAINGQRGSGAVFAMDGIYVTDPELGGATFANFNVDAIEEIQSESGVMPAEVGAGAAGFTDVVTKSGSSAIHGSAFEFLRNAALDARNFFDRRTAASPRRIPPFTRNEFGFTIGGPLMPGRHAAQNGGTFFFGEYQGFRQVLGTTEVFPVPTPAERAGVDTTTVPGDTLFVPVSPIIAPVLARYPPPSDPQGPYGARTHATSARVPTASDQFSLRLDRAASDKSRMYARFTWNNVSGPLVNPSQATIDPSFALYFRDRQRNLGLKYLRQVTPMVSWEIAVGALRSTPFFHSPNTVQPALVFGDGLFEPFNAQGGGVLGAFGNIFQARYGLGVVRGPHTMKAGFETRMNRDTLIAGIAPNGVYAFGGGAAYSPVDIPSASGLNDIHVGDQLPDSLTGLLTATPYSYFASVAAPLFPQGDHIGESAVRRESYNAFFQDAWKVTPRLQLTYGLRYEVNSRLREAHHRTSQPDFVGGAGGPVPTWTAGATEKFLFYPKPPYRRDWNGWGPRLSLDWNFTDKTVFRAGGAVTTDLPNIFQSNGLMGGVPFVFNPFFTATPTSPVAFDNTVRQSPIPPVYTAAGQPLFASGGTEAVPPNTRIDIQRFENDWAALTSGNQVQALFTFGMERHFSNGYMESWTAGLEHTFRDVTVSASYVGTAGVGLISIVFPNAYPAADPAFAPFTAFDSSGNVTGGFGPEGLMSNRSHSTFHSLEAGVSKTSARAGLGFQASYTFSKSLDDSSSIFGGFGSGSAGTVLQTFPQDPRNPGAEKGPSVFDVRHVGVFSLIQVLPLDRAAGIRRLGPRATKGWELLNITTLFSGLPFSVFSGVQQSGLGTFNADRPDQIGRPVLSTNRTVREDYFGAGASNDQYFFIPLAVPGGTGPNQGRLGSLGRDTFRGPAYHGVDVALIKDTPVGRRGQGEAMSVEVRGEFFNVFNLVNFGLPANIVRGTGFGLITRTAGPSRQIQFSVKLIF